MPKQKQHFRVLTKLADGRFVIQRPHFKTTEDAHAWIGLYEFLMIPGETAQPVRDFDDRIYPFWKPNHPKEKP